MSKKDNSRIYWLDLEPEWTGEGQAVGASTPTQTPCTEGYILRGMPFKDMIFDVFDYFNVRLNM